MMRCLHCRFWDRQRIWGEKNDKASCRANPPTVRRGGLACDPNGEWPTTYATDWCGHFKPSPRPSTSLPVNTDAGPWPRSSEATKCFAI